MTVLTLSPIGDICALTGDFPHLQKLSLAATPIHPICHSLFLGQIFV